MKTNYFPKYHQSIIGTWNLWSYIAIKNEYLGINLKKYVEDSYDVNYITLMSAIKEDLEDLNKCFHWPEENFVKMSVFCNWIYRFNAIPMKIPTSYFTK